MRDLERTTDFGIVTGDQVVGGATAAIDGAATVIPVLEETLRISKREVVTGRVRVSTRTETHEEVAETTLDRSVVDVTRVPVAEFVDVPPKVRTVGDTTIVPVVEERLVMVKRLFLIEELHIRHHVEQETFSETVPLRRQNVTIERMDVDDRATDTPSTNVE